VASAAKITLSKARTQGLQFYYTGIPCVRGHISKRRVRNACCLQCEKIHGRKSHNKTIASVFKTPERWAKLRIRDLKTKAKKRALDFDITFQDLLPVPECCPVLGIPLAYNAGRRNENSVSIDRLDNKKGYVKGNIKIMSWRANNIKSNATFEEIEKVYNFLRELI